MEKPGANELLNFFCSQFNGLFSFAFGYSVHQLDIIEINRWTTYKWNC